MTKILQSAATRAMRYLDDIGERAVAPAAEAVAALVAFDEAMPVQGADAGETLDLLDRIGSPATMAMAGPRYFGFVIGGALPATLAANWLAGAWDQNCAFDHVTPSTSRLESVALRWMLDLLGLPAGSAGAFVTGATVANFTALAAARHAVLKQVGWNVEADGLFGAPPITVIVGNEVHASVIKALGMLGLGRTRLTRVPVDGQGRIRADALPPAQGPTIVCTQIGNVNTGAFDPLADIVDHYQGSGAWIHVDGAFGLWAAASPRLSALVTGLAGADSWATDAHKWLNVPYDSGVAFVRDAHALRAAMAISADYLPLDNDRRNPCEYTPELSRRARGVEVWAALRNLGRAGLAELIERNCRQARRFAEALHGAGHAVLNEVVLNQVLVSFGDADTNQRVMTALQAEGSCWCAGTVWQGQSAMRISVSSWATTDADVEIAIAAILKTARAERR
jgi:glutamate/tyrosine decarboxylase-like PLP-dependent enzyme